MLQQKFYQISINIRDYPDQRAIRLSRNLDKELQKNYLPSTAGWLHKRLSPSMLDGPFLILFKYKGQQHQTGMISKHRTRMEMRGQQRNVHWARSSQVKKVLSPANLPLEALQALLLWWTTRYSPSYLTPSLRQFFSTAGGLYLAPITYAS